MWGQVIPGWLSAVGTVGATAAAAWGLWRAERATSHARIAAAEAEERTRQLEVAERERQRIADERAQADRVDVSETRVPFEVVDEPEARPASAASLTGGPAVWNPVEHDVASDGLVTVAEVLNTSSRAISDVTVFWMGPGGSAQLASRHIDALQIESFGRIRKQRPLGLLTGVRRIAVELEFTDARGRRWRKDRDGELHRLDVNAAASNG